MKLFYNLHPNNKKRKINSATLLSHLDTNFKFQILAQMIHRTSPLLQKWPFSWQDHNSSWQKLCVLSVNRAYRRGVKATVYGLTPFDPSEPPKQMLSSDNPSSRLIKFTPNWTVTNGMLRNTRGSRGWLLNNSYEDAFNSRMPRDVN